MSLKRDVQKNPEKLWEIYYSDQSNVAELLEFYSPLVRQNALSLARQLPKHIDVDDLISEGYFGLADAISKFDPDYGYKFETYASFRIKGHIRDHLRGSDWAPRSLRSKAKEIEAASAKLSAELNREPTTEEIASLLGWDTEDVFSVSRRVSSASFSNLDDLVSTGSGTKFSLSDLLPDKESDPLPDFSVLKERLVGVIQDMHPQHSTVLALYYIEDLPLKKIGELMKVTESRACQIHTDALEALWKGCLPE